VAAQSSHEDGSLQLLLDALIEVAVLNKSDARVLSEALAEPTTVGVRVGALDVQLSLP
jgi:hypothetical protein